MNARRPSTIDPSILFSAPSVRLSLVDGNADDMPSFNLLWVNMLSQLNPKVELIGMNTRRSKL